MVTFEERADEFEPKLMKLSNFRFGKTSRPVEEVYEQKYSSNYQGYEIVGSSVIKRPVEDFEKYIIDRFKDYPACETKKPESEKEMQSSKEYYVYLVYND